MRERKNITRDKFGRLTMLEFVGRKNNNSYWLCKCECGSEKEVAYGNLVSGKTKSCGCLYRESRHFLKKKKYFDLTETQKKLLTRWQCKKTTANYCEEWKNDFYSFCKDVENKFKKAVKENPDKKILITKIDKNKKFSRDNFKCTTREQLARKALGAKKIFYKGEEVYVAELAKKHNISRQALHARLNRGWSVEDAISRPIQKQ